MQGTQFPLVQEGRYALKLVKALSGASVPAAPTSWLSQELGTEWRTVSCHLLRRPGVKLALAALGWSYRPQRGRKGGLFVKTGADKRQAVETAVGLPWATITGLLMSR
jgi:hypothetical protein